MHNNIIKIYKLLLEESDMFNLKNLFGKNDTTKNTDPYINIYAPCSGTMVKTAEIPDETFANNVLGPTYGLMPNDGKIYAPCSGIITQVFKTSHAFTITTPEKLEILVHVGVNTIDLQGEGFKALVEENQSVKYKDPILECDLNLIKSKNFSPITSIVICNPETEIKECQLIEHQDPLTVDSIIFKVISNL